MFLPFSSQYQEDFRWIFFYHFRSTYFDGGFFYNFTPSTLQRKKPCKPVPVAFLNSKLSNLVLTGSDLRHYLNVWTVSIILRAWFAIDACVRRNSLFLKELPCPVVNAKELPYWSFHRLLNVRHADPDGDARVAPRNSISLVLRDTHGCISYISRRVFPYISLFSFELIKVANKRTV